MYRAKILLLKTKRLIYNINEIHVYCTWYFTVHPLLESFDLILNQACADHPLNLF